MVLTPRDVFERKTVAGARRGRRARRAPPTAGRARRAARRRRRRGAAHPDRARGCSSAAATSTGSPRPCCSTLPAGVDRDGARARRSQAVLDRHDMLRARLARRRAGTAGRHRGAADRGGRRRTTCCAGSRSPRSPARSSTAVGGRATRRGRGPAGPGRRACMVQVVWFDVRAPGAGPAAGRRAPPRGRRGVLADPGARPGAAWAQVARGPASRTSPPVGTSMRRWAHALAEADARPRRRAGPCGAGCSTARTRCSARGRSIPAVDVDATVEQGRRSSCPPTVTEALLTTRARGVPRRRQRRAAHRAGAGGGPVAARPRRATRPATLVRLEGHGREEQVVPGRRPVPHRRLVHHDVPGAPRPVRHRPRRRVRRRHRPPVRRSRRSRSSCARSRTTASATGCCAT